MRRPWITLIAFLVVGVLSADSCTDDIEDAGIPDSEDSRIAGAQSTALWEKPIEGHIRTLLAADESKAYLGFCGGGEVEIEAWRLTDGERLWRTHLPYSCRPIVSSELRGTRENLLIHLYYPRPPHRDALVALNIADGAVKWELKGRIMYLDSIFPFLHVGEGLYRMVVGPEMAYISLDNSLVALDHKTGNRRWQLSTGRHKGAWGLGGLVGNRLYLCRRPGTLPLRVLDAKTGKDLPPPPLPEFVHSRLNQENSGWINMPTIGHDRLFFRFDAGNEDRLVGYDLVSGEWIWILEGDAFYPKYAKGGKLYTLYRPRGVFQGLSPANEKLWIASIDGKTGNIDWQVPYEGKNALVFVEIKGSHLLAVDRKRGAQVHQVKDGSLVWISTDDTSADTLVSGGTRLLHITNRKVSLIPLE